MKVLLETQIVNNVTGEVTTLKKDFRVVTSFKEASAAVRAYIDKHHLGSGGIPQEPYFAGGAVTDRNKPVAQVSYNGKVWEWRKEGWRDGDVPLYDPSAS